MTPADFIATYGQYAQQIGQQTHIDPSVILGVISTETGAGEHIAGNNLGGISPSGPNGQYVAGYPDVETGGRALVDLLNSKRYANVQNAQGPDAQAIALQLAGYNSVNPNYGVQVADSAASYRTAGFNKQPTAAAPAAAAPAATDAGPSVDDLLNLRGLGSKPQTPQAPDTGPSVDDLMKLRPNMKITPPVDTGPVSGAPISPQEAAMPAVDPQMPGRFTNPATPAPAGPGAIPQTGLGSAVGTIWDTAKAIPDTISVGVAQGAANPNLLTPQAQSYLNQNYPITGKVAGALGSDVGAITGGLSGGFQAGLNMLSAVGNDILPPNRGGSFGNALAGAGEYEATRSIATHGAPELNTVSATDGVPPPAPPTPVAGAYEALPAAARADALDARAAKVQPPVADATAYVPESKPPLAESNRTPDNVAEYDALKRHDPSQSTSAAQGNNNDARVQYATTPVTDANGNTVSGADTSAGNYAALRANRSTQATQNLGDAFMLQQPVSVGPVINGINQVLASPDGLRPTIAAPLQQVMDRINSTAKNGVADPDRLYAVRQSIDDMLDRSNANNAGNIQAKVQLQKVQDDLDGVIQPGTTAAMLKQITQEGAAISSQTLASGGSLADAEEAANANMIQRMMPAIMNTLKSPEDIANAAGVPVETVRNAQTPADLAPIYAQATHNWLDHLQKSSSTDYDTYMNNYRVNSQPINQIDALRDAGYDNMTNAQGVMTRTAVQNVIDNLRGGVRNNDRNAMAVTDGSWNTLFNLRDDLARKEALITPLGNMRSSALTGSTQQRINLEKQATSGGVMSHLLGLGASAVTNLGVNALVSGGMSPIAGTAADMAANIFGTKVKGALAARAGNKLLSQWRDHQMPPEAEQSAPSTPGSMLAGLPSSWGFSRIPNTAPAPTAVLPLSLYPERGAGIQQQNAVPGMDDGGLVDVTQFGNDALTGIANDPAYSGQGGAALNSQMRDNANAKILRDREGEQKARGGLIGGGPPGRDTVPVHLSNGEFVVRRQSVAALGVKHLAALNEMHKMPAAKQARIRNALQGVL